MAGITDRPFRRLCRVFGASLAATEMTLSKPELWFGGKTCRRLDLEGEPAPRAVQIAGADPARMADAARHAVDLGAQIIDINMGCPARKVCRVAAGSALLGDERLAGRILTRVVEAVSVPVTLKMRTGLVPEQKNADRIARIAETAGIQAITIHGRTRACGFQGRAEHQTTRKVKESVSIPVIANGDIDSPENAAAILAETGADGLMIGRAACGKPWLFREIEHYLAHGKYPDPLSDLEKMHYMLQHLGDIHAFYGEYSGVRIARKHIVWYLGRPHARAVLLARIQQEERADIQLDLFADLFQSICSGRMAA